MQESSFPSGENSLRNQALVSHGGPSFLRRAQKAEEALRLVLDQLARTRHQWLEMVRLRLGQLYAVVGDWKRLEPSIGQETVSLLRQLHEEHQPQLRMPVEVSNQPRIWRKALEELRESLRYFNRRWQQHLAQIDLEPINRRREEYNRYYVLEKECALGSPILARRDFRPLEPIVPEDLLRTYPLLPELQVGDGE